jgi:hypothetical protein
MQPGVGMQKHDNLLTGVLILLVIGTFIFSWQKTMNISSVKAIAGPRGATGATGATGSSGLPGATGAIGLTGIQGLKGLTGTAGATGAAGTNGAIGPRGPAGQDGVGSSTVIQLSSTLLVDQNTYNLDEHTVIPVDPVHLAYGEWSNSEYAPAVQYAANTQILNFGGFSTSAIDTTNDQYDLSMTLIVKNTYPGSNQSITVNCFKAASGGPGSTATMSASDCSSNVSGNELSYDTSSGSVTTNTASFFDVYVYFHSGWD